MGKTMSKYQLMESELKYHVERYDSLERHTETLLGEKEEEIREANEKIAREREHFFKKI